MIAQRRMELARWIDACVHDVLSEAADKQHALELITDMLSNCMWCADWQNAVLVLAVYHSWLHADPVITVATGNKDQWSRHTCQLAHATLASVITERVTREL